jgi:hypothetical protein
MAENLIQDLRNQAQEAWNNHFNMCSEKGIWNLLNVSLSDIKSLELSWKLRWMEAKLDTLTNN